MFKKCLFLITLFSSLAWSNHLFRLSVGPYFSEGIVGPTASIGVRRQFDNAVSITFETGLTYLSNDQSLGNQNSVLEGHTPNLNSASIDSHEVFIVPLLIGLHITIPVDFSLKPHLFASLGGNFAFDQFLYNQNQTEGNIYSQFAWKVGVGGQVPLGTSSLFFFDVYFNWGELDRINDESSAKIDLSGFVIAFGIEFGDNKY